MTSAGRGAARILGDIQGSANEVRDLVEGLVKKEFVETASDLLPFLLRGLGKLVCVGVEPLMEQPDGEDGFRAATSGKFRQLLEEYRDLLAKIEASLT